jgi:hypothetical protein
MFQDLGFIRIYQVIRYPGRQPVIQGDHLTNPGFADAGNCRKVIIGRIGMILEVRKVLKTNLYRAGIFPFRPREIVFLILSKSKIVGRLNLIKPPIP